jgi:hypothetical protein
MYDSTQDTQEHIRKVRARIQECISRLTIRAAHHDASKLQEPEKSGFDRIGPPGHVAYSRDGQMTPEYQAFLDTLGSTLDHHYAHNSHHPQFARVRSEEWRPVAGFEGYYEVSNFGDVRSVDRIVPRDGPTGNMMRKGQLITPHVTPKGYLRCQLGMNGQKANKMVHRLVAEAFIPNPDDKPEVNHRNGNKQDNHIDNLEWATQSENQTHAYQLGLKKPAVKYVVTCVELDITTFGTEKMQNELRQRGYDNAHSAAIWSCIAGDAHSHLGLTFTSVNVEDYTPLSDMRFMTLLDLVEWLCDIKAAGERYKDGNLGESLKTNRTRFGISDQLYSILENTVRELGW